MSGPLVEPRLGGFGKAVLALGVILAASLVAGTLVALHDRARKTTLTHCTLRMCASVISVGSQERPESSEEAGDRLLSRCCDHRRSIFTRERAASLTARILS